MSDRFYSLRLNRVNEPFVECSPRVDLVGNRHVFFKWIFVTEDIKVLWPGATNKNPHEITHGAVFADEAKTIRTSVFTVKRGIDTGANNLTRLIENWTATVHVGAKQ